MHCWAQYLFVILVAILGTGSALIACGQKGDLYLPERPEGSAAPAHQGQDVPLVRDPDASAVDL